MRGQDWGELAPVPSDAVWAADDADAAHAVEEARRAGRDLPPLCLTGGDLARTLGGRGDAERLRATGGTHVPVDLGAALVDGRLHWFVAHLVARGPWLLGRIVIAANAAFIGSWNIAPHAHSGDGRLDILDGDPSFGDRLRARRRLPRARTFRIPRSTCGAALPPSSSSRGPLASGSTGALSDGHRR